MTDRDRKRFVPEKYGKGVNGGWGMVREQKNERK